MSCKNIWFCVYKRSWKALESENILVHILHHLILSVLRYTDDFIKLSACLFSTHYFYPYSTLNLSTPSFSENPTKFYFRLFTTNPEQKHASCFSQNHADLCAQISEQISISPDLNSSWGGATQTQNHRRRRRQREEQMYREAESTLQGFIPTPTIKVAVCVSVWADLCIITNVVKTLTEL